MLLGTAFLLGWIGSLHCVGMCGPLVLALPTTQARFPAVLLDRLLYNAGRIATYVGLGCVFGLLGESFAAAGWQRGVSVTAGVMILLGLMLSARLPLSRPALRLVAGVRPWVGDLLRRRHPGAQFALGLLNGLLPCGLVYVACAGAAASGRLTQGALVMAAFGLGTLPMMLGLGLAGARLQDWTRRLAPQRWVPASLMIVAALLILRGMALGIPYLSPGVAPESCPACHAPPPAPEGSLSPEPTSF